MGGQFFLYLKMIFLSECILKMFYSSWSLLFIYFNVCVVHNFEKSRLKCNPFEGGKCVLKTHFQSRTLHKADKLAMASLLDLMLSEKFAKHSGSVGFFPALKKYLLHKNSGNGRNCFVCLLKDFQSVLTIRVSSWKIVETNKYFIRFSNLHIFPSVKVTLFETIVQKALIYILLDIKFSLIFMKTPPILSIVYDFFYFWLKCIVFHTLKIIISLLFIGIFLQYSNFLDIFVFFKKIFSGSLHI